LQPKEEFDAYINIAMGNVKFRDKKEGPASKRFAA